MILSGIPHTTLALFLSGAFVERHGQVLIITDDTEKDAEIRTLGPYILDTTVRVLEDTGEIFLLPTLHERVIIVPSHLLRVSGTLEHIERTTTRRIARDMTLPHHTLIEDLIAWGYMQTDYAGESGTYTREGAMIRIWYEDREYVIEYFDDVIDSIIEISPRGRVHRDHIILTRIGHETEKSDIAISTPLLENLSHMPTLLMGCEFLRERESIIANFRDMIEFSSLSREGATRLDVSIPTIESIPDFSATLETHRDAGILTVSRYEKKLREFLDMNQSTHIPSLEHKHMHASFELKGASTFLGAKWASYIKNDTFHLYGDDIFGRIFVVNRTRKSTIKNLDLLMKLEPGDLVVHREHGIGRYIQILRKRIGLIEREYMEVEYQKGDKVYVPMTELARITKYVGESTTELSNLEGKEWERTLSKTDEEVEAIAEDILATEARRSLTTRIPFGKFPTEESAFIDAFAYTHTPDQMSIIEDIRADLEGPHPMDRLVAGDVGFGKTEIAMNAAYKAVLSGLQVAVISPLLILAEEHRETFEERLGAFGVRVRALTRMTHARDVKKILEEMRLGTVDIIVGTHRLLSEDVRFRRLGLLIIDEEHRFGVVQKEAIKKMKAHIDILSLSATPIPRSLHLALSGLKKISLLTTPPPSKKPIDTIVTRWEDHTIRSAIRAELERGGQIIILHNRVRSLSMIEREIMEILGSDTRTNADDAQNVNGGIGDEKSKKSSKSNGDAQKQEVRGRRPLIHEVNLSSTLGVKNISTGVYSDVHEGEISFSDDEIRRFSVSPRIITTHGQMNPDDIEERILAFKQHKYDILITTTIIENGVNFLGANTILVSDAEEFGLAQLHQIRGRVGRKDIPGVCYLLYRKYELSSEERERLMILSEHSALGSGYEIAMRDMQMRGTGDVLGWRQSGKSKEVGISLYFQLLEEKISTIKNGKKDTNACKIDLELSYVIDADEFDSEMDRLAFFRDIESIETLEDLDMTESTFRTADMPEPMSNLFLMMRTSIIMRQYGVVRISKMGTQYHFDFRDDAAPAMLRAFLERFDTTRDMIIVSIHKIKVETRKWKDAREFLLALTR